MWRICFRVLLLIASSLVAAPPLHAFNKTGHRIVAQIATEFLSDDAREEIEELLGKNGLVYAANWADEIKVDPGYDYAKPWHYLNIDREYQPDELPAVFESVVAQSGNVVSVIDSLMSVLENNRSDTTALRFLIHLVGDLHQPLHLGRSSDLGGNRIMIRWFADSINLHALWDTYLISYEQLSYTEYSQWLLDLDFPIPNTYTLQQAFSRSYLISRRIYQYDYQRMNEYRYYNEFANDLKESLFNGGRLLGEMLNHIYS